MERGERFDMQSKSLLKSSYEDIARARTCIPLEITRGNEAKSNQENVNGEIKEKACRNRLQQIKGQHEQLHMPMVKVERIMRRMLPHDAIVNEDAKQAIQQSVSEFIRLTTSKANEQCRSESRKTVRADDIISAMGELGFENYVAPLGAYLKKHRDHKSLCNAAIVMHNKNLGTKRDYTTFETKDGSQVGTSGEPHEDEPNAIDCNATADCGSSTNDDHFGTWV